jgi:hypothetical protein
MQVHIVRVSLIRVSDSKGLGCLASKMEELLYMFNLKSN